MSYWGIDTAVGGKDHVCGGGLMTIMGHVCSRRLRRVIIIGGHGSVGMGPVPVIISVDVMLRHVFIITSNLSSVVHDRPRSIKQLLFL